jgi:hypothetical protein
VGATLFEWSTCKPYMYPRVETRHDVAFYVDIHQLGRLVENQELDGVIRLLKNQNGKYRREPLIPDRNQKSMFASVLNILCDKESNKRRSAAAILQSTELTSCILCIRTRAEKRNL